MVRLMLLALGLALALVAGNLAAGEPQPADNPPQPQPADKPPQPPKARPPDPIGDNLFPPDLIMRCADQIGLTDEQKDSIKSQMEKAQPRFKDLQQKLEQEAQAMGEILKQEHPDADEAVAQFDKVLDAEREVKRVHITLLVALKNLLTPEQQAQLRELRKKFPDGKGPKPGGDVPQAIQMKMMNVQRQAQELAKEGRDVAAVREAMGRFEPLIRERKFAEAEAVLDEALKVLGEVAGGQ